jgi:TolB-like protein/tetratricopeptide (TPR) repeat protein
MDENGSEEKVSAIAPTLFISYASQDAALADTIVEALERSGLKCWIAPRDVVPGALYADEIVRAINGARAVVLILSEYAVASPHVGKEIERASSKRRRIFALRTGAVSLPRAFEYFLSESQWIDVGSGGVEAAAAKLVEAVRRHIDPSWAVETPVPSTKQSSSRKTAVPSATWLLVSGVVVASIALVYFVVDHLWLSKAAVNGTAAQTATVARAPPAASIAVLPFSDLSAEGNQGYFSDGIAEEILNVLAHVKGLKVASRTSAFQFRKSDLGIPAIAEKLDVRHILEGSVRKAGNTVRITAQLIDASTDQHEWSQTFDRPLTTANLFAIQDEIAKTIVDHLAAMIGGTVNVAEPAARKADTADQDAYELYLEGRSLFVARSKQNLINAAVALKTAVAKDPKFARAWEMLGAVLVISRSWNVGNEGDYQAGADAIDTAIRLDPNLSLAYAVRSEVKQFAVPSRGAAGWDDSSDDLSRAIENDGTNATAYVWRGEQYAALGYLDHAIQDYQRCLEIDPAYELARRHLAMASLYRGQTDEALRLLEAGFENGYSFLGDVVLTSTVAARGDRVGALSLLLSTYKDDPDLIRPLFRALTDPTFGDRERRDAVALVKGAKNSGEFVPMAFLILKAYDQIVAVDTDPPIWWDRSDAAWLRSQSRKLAMEHWHMPEYWHKHGFPPQCRPIGESDFECR